MYVTEDTGVLRFSCGRDKREPNRWPYGAIKVIVVTGAHGIGDAYCLRLTV
jgi:hypothetical protein